MKIGYRAHIVQPKFEQQGGAEISSIRTAKQATPGPHQRNRGDTPIIFHRRIARTIVWSKPIFDIRTLQADFVSSAHLIFFFFNPSISLFFEDCFSCHRWRTTRESCVWSFYSISHPPFCTASAGSAFSKAIIHFAERLRFCINFVSSFTLACTYTCGWRAFFYSFSEIVAGVTTWILFSTGRAK